MKFVLRVKAPKGVADPRAWWTAEDTLAVAWSAIALIRLRTLKGIDSSGKPFVPYSTRGPIYVNPNRGIGARLKPKGGKPTRIGKNPGRAGVTQKFADYGDYKDKSSNPAGVLSFPMAGATARENLTASGLLLNSMRPREYSRYQALIGVGDETRSYAQGVHDRRPFMGLSDADLVPLRAGIEQRLAARLAGLFRVPS